MMYLLSRHLQSQSQPQYDEAGKNSPRTDGMQSTLSVMWTKSIHMESVFLNYYYIEKFGGIIV
jgi:hypothetical protein